MPIATANDMVIETVTATTGIEAGPGVEHAQVLGTEGGKRVSLTIAIKKTSTAVAGFKLFVEIHGSTDLVNWHPLSTASTSFDFNATYTNPANIDGISVDGWPWVRVRYYLRADSYANVLRVLLTATLSVAG